MKISTKGRYGLKAVIDMAFRQEQGALSISNIAAKNDISESYLEQLFAKLKKANIVKSIRGAQGGYVLAKDTGDISVGDILRALEGDLNPVDCPELSKDGKCTGSQACVSKIVWKKINDSVNKAVDEITLKSLIEESKK